MSRKTVQPAGGPDCRISMCRLNYQILGAGGIAGEFSRHRRGGVGVRLRELNGVSTYYVSNPAFMQKWFRARLLMPRKAFCMGSPARWRAIQRELIDPCQDGIAGETQPRRATRRRRCRSRMLKPLRTALLAIRTSLEYFGQDQND
jgi:hypothetical protein